jgi:hypothetical protein
MDTMLHFAFKERNGFYPQIKTTQKPDILHAAKHRSHKTLGSITYEGKGWLWIYQKMMETVRNPYSSDNG